jgi:Domain of unknown function (DUF4145)
MAQLIENCPRCGAKSITFDMLSDHLFALNYSWQRVVEAFCVCRSCERSTVFILKQSHTDYERIFDNGLHSYESVVNRYVEIDGYVNIKYLALRKSPEYVPENIEEIFKEAVTCLSLNCFNASATMFRLCLDTATRSLLPSNDIDGLNKKIRRSLGFRLKWLFDTKRLPDSFRELSSCVKDDGNDGAHAGTLASDDSEDLLDFTIALLERLYTEPEKLRLAKERRAERRKEQANQSS